MTVVLFSANMYIYIYTYMCVICSMQIQSVKCVYVDIHGVHGNVFAQDGCTKMSQENTYSTSFHTEYNSV